MRARTNHQHVLCDCQTVTHAARPTPPRAGLRRFHEALAAYGAGLNVDPGNEALLQGRAMVVDTLRQLEAAAHPESRRGRRKGTIARDRPVFCTGKSACSPRHAAPPARFRRAAGLRSTSRSPPLPLRASAARSPCSS